MNGRMNVTAERGSATLPADRAWRLSGVGDFNGDGDDDVLLRHADGRWRYYPMDGRRALASDSGAPPLTRFPEWQIAGAGDFNGDAKHDVLVRHADGAWYYYPLDGPEILSAAEGDAQVSRNLAWQLAGVGDFNGNGRHDVLLRNVDGRWFYYPMYGRRHSVSGRGTANMTPNLDWQLAGIGDFNATVAMTSWCGTPTAAGTTTRCVDGERSVAAGEQIYRRIWPGRSQRSVTSTATARTTSCCAIPTGGGTTTR